jgi:hypothetical protein
MLEEPEYRNIVRWTENGDSFVVIDVSINHQKKKKKQKLTPFNS